MAMNPMQRRARNAFLIGFLIALIIMAVVVLLLIKKMNGIKDDLSKLQKLQTQVYVAADDLKSGDILNFEEDFSYETVQTTVDPNAVISETDWDFPEETYKEKGNGEFVEIKKDLMLKVDVPKGTIVTKDMVTEVDEVTKTSDRIVEYNMFILPSTLKNGDYIDIRLLLPSGKDYVVISKKRVLGCNETTIWLKVTEEEILLLNNAIVEAYTISGSKLYASLYAEAGMQEALETTYMPSTDVMALILQDPNIVQEASAAIYSRYDITYRTQTFETAIDPYRESQDSLVASGNSQEVSSMKAARQNYVQALEGTEDVGYER